MHKSRYQERFAALNATGHGAFIPFTLLGWPSVEASFEIIQTMLDAGVSALELGFPFSDPMADGPIIQAAGLEALANGFRVDDGFALLTRIRACDAAIPISLLLYYNIVLQRGIEPFFKDCQLAGVDGVLIADLPPEAAEEVAGFAAAYGVALIFIVSPLTRSARLDRLLLHASGFVYVVSRLGITGTEERYDENLASLLATIREKSTLPCCVGFGISSPQQAANMCQLGADGVITGSKIIQLMQDAATTKDGLQVLTTFCQSMRGAMMLQATR